MSTTDMMTENEPAPKAPETMRAAVYRGVTLTTICGTDVHILRGEHPVPRGGSSATSRLG